MVGNVFSTLTNADLSAKDANYKREYYYSLLTATEWRNVAMAVELSANYQQQLPFYQMPYFRHIFTLWRIYYLSMKHAITVDGFNKVFFSEYNTMCLFIAIMTTIECTIKGTLALPFKALELCKRGLSKLFRKKYQPSKDTSYFQQSLANMQQEYAEFIHHTPFFIFDYFKYVEPILGAIAYDLLPRTIASLIVPKAYTPQLAPTSTKTSWYHKLTRPLAIIPNSLIFTYTMLEIAAKGLISVAVRQQYAQIAANGEQLQSTEPDTIDLLVKRDSNVELDPALQETEEVQATKVKSGETSKHPEIIYSKVTVPRYQAFTQTLRDLAKYQRTSVGPQQRLNIKRIAGQRYMQIDLIVNSKHIQDAWQAIFNSTYDYGAKERSRILYSYNNSIDNDRVLAVKVDVADILNLINNIDNHNEAAGMPEERKIKYGIVHDF